MTDSPDPEDIDVLAAEYVLGLLDEATAREAHSLALTDPTFAAEVTFWQERLATLAEETAPVVPGVAAKRALMARLFGKDPKTSWLASLGLWRGLTTAALLAVAVLGYQVATYDRIPTLYATELVSDTGDLRVLAVYDSVTGHIRITRTDGGAGPGRDLELWAIAEGQAPIAVGLLPDDRIRAGYALPEGLDTIAAGLTLAISDEPDGGSPTGQPTGAVLALGAIEEI